MRRAFPPALFWFGVVALAVSACALVNSLRAQAPEGPDTTESTTEDSTGTVTAVSPYFTITVSDRRGPFTYRLGQDVHIYGPDNHPLKISQVFPGDEATVYYYFRDNHPTVARIVVLRRSKSHSGK